MESDYIMTSANTSVEAVGNWLLQHIDELLEKYPELKEKLRKKLLEELEEKIATKDEILAVLNELKKLREDFNRQQEQINGIMAELKKLREDFNKLAERLDLKLSALGVMCGLYSENAFRNAMRYIIEKYFGGRVQRWTYFDSDGVVYGHPSEIDVDVLVRDNEHLLIEIRAHTDRSDVAELYRKGILYGRVVGVKPKLVIVAPFVRDRAYKTAAKLGVEIIEGIPEA